MKIQLGKVNSMNQNNAYRIESIDLLRGLVMIIMALDHTRENFHALAYTGDPLNLQTTTPVLFLTRWITHFCAPVFVFLSGTSVFLQSLRKSKAALSSFLIKRGLWLILVELSIMTFAVTFDISYSIFILVVIWAIGLSMVLLGLAIWLPFKMILAIGLLIVFGHNSLDFWEARQGGSYSIWYSFIHRPGIYPLSEDHALGIFYPFLPWVGVMFLGYCFGKFYEGHITKTKNIIVYIGVGAMLLFMMLRWSNVYGDPLPWSPQKNALLGFFSFINTQKYPPSLLFICMTLGPALIFLGLAGNIRNRIQEIITVYGRVPFFYYILHFYLLHGISMILFLVRGHSWKEGVEGVPGFPFKFIIPGEGYSLGIVFFVWIAVVIALYPACKWFSEYKRTNKKWWLSYI